MVMGDYTVLAGFSNLEKMIGRESAKEVRRKAKIQEECTANRHLNTKTKKQYSYSVIIPSGSSSMYPWECRSCSHCESLYRV